MAHMPDNHLAVRHVLPRFRMWRGETTTTGWFVPGHDQKALHERVARIGTVYEFIQWFDRTHPADPVD